MLKRALQIFAALNALIALYNGGKFVVLGIEAVPLPKGLELQLAEPVRGLLDTWYRVLGWTWLTTGLMLAWITPKIETQTVWFRLIFVAFMCVGVGRLAAVIAHGFTAENTVLAIALEIAIPAACLVWHAIVVRQTRG